MESKKNPDKDIHRKSGLFFSIGLCTSLTLVIIAFHWQVRVEQFVYEPRDPWEDLIVMTTVAEISPEEKPKVIKRTQNTVLVKEVVRIEEATAEMPTTEAAPDAAAEPANVSGANTVAVEAPATEGDFIIVEEMPRPVGGYDYFYAEAGRQLRYPRKAVRYNIEGTVYVEFVVDTDGRATEFKTIRGIGYGCDDEAIRVLSMMKWEPGRQGNKAVRVRMILPLKFRLQ